MAAFDDSSDPDLGAACNRLAMWVESLPERALIDPASELAEDDLALILRRLHAMRHLGRIVLRRTVLPPPSRGHPCR
ncbi:hypothetical protein GCM10020258_35600 [Sphingomonas yabuuchiae]